MGGEHRRVDHSYGIVLEPHQVAVVCTREKLRIPRYLIARWSLRVTNIYEGLLWTGGPQVDPGWEGPLFCPVYNLAERTVVLKYGDPLFTIDFTRTTPITDEIRRLSNTPEYSKIWFAPQRRTLSKHDSHRLHSAPYEALRELRELRYFRNIGYVAISIIMLVLTFIVAALAVVAVKPTVDLGGPFLSFWPMTALVGALSSLVFSVGQVLLAFWFGGDSVKSCNFLLRLNNLCKTAMSVTSMTSASMDYYVPCADALKLRLLVTLYAWALFGIFIQTSLTTPMESISATLVVLQ